MGAGGILYLPQKPLLARGGLAAQVTYPDPPPAPPPLGGVGAYSQILSALRLVGMEGLLERVEGDWQVGQDATGPAAVITCLLMSSSMSPAP